MWLWKWSKQHLERKYFSEKTKKKPSDNDLEIFRPIRRKQTDNVMA